jgi:hypothetical protein
MSEVDIPQPIKSRPHGLAVREDFHGTVEYAEHYPYHAATYDCKCGTAGYRIFVDQVHYGEGQRFQKYVATILEGIHSHNARHPEVIQIPMEAELTT